MLILNIEQVDENKIKVTVNAKEQLEYGISYETMNYGDANTRRLCEKIISRAGREMGFCLGDAKLLVEARQSYNGNVTLYLSRIPYGKNDVTFYELCIRYDTLNDLMDSMFNFADIIDKIQSSAIYIYERIYYLVFGIVCAKTEYNRLLARLSEYGEKAKVRPEFITEHGTPINNDYVIHRFVETLNK